jgi:hypothetical protein
MMFACNEVVWISLQFSSEERVPILRHTKEVIGAFVTAGARIHLYTCLGILQDKAIFCEADSVLYVQPNDGGTLVGDGGQFGGDDFRTETQ